MRFVCTNRSSILHWAKLYHSVMVTSIRAHSIHAFYFYINKNDNFRCLLFFWKILKSLYQSDARIMNSKSCIGYANVESLSKITQTKSQLKSPKNMPKSLFMIILSIPACYFSIVSLWILSFDCFFYN